MILLTFIYTYELWNAIYSILMTSLIAILMSLYVCVGFFFFFLLKSFVETMFNSTELVKLKHAKCVEVFVRYPIKRNFSLMVGLRCVSFPKMLLYLEIATYFMRLFVV